MALPRHLRTGVPSTWASTAAIQLSIQFELSRDGLSLPSIEQLMITNWWFGRVPHLVNAC
jgi:hypothetical protein